MKGPARALVLAAVVVGALFWLHLQTKASRSAGLAWVQRVVPDEILIQRVGDDFEVHWLNLDGRWAFNTPGGYVPDQLVARDVAETLRDLRVEEGFEPEEPLASYGLGEGAFRVVVRAKHREVAFRLGNSGGARGRDYLLVEGEDLVVPSGQWLTDRLARPLEDFVDRRLAPHTPDEITSVRVQAEVLVPGVGEGAERTGLLLEIRRRPDGEWQDMLGDRPVSTRAALEIVRRLLLTEGETLLHYNLLTPPALRVSLGVEGEEEPLDVRFEPGLEEWAAWGKFQFGFGMGGFTPADLPWQTGALDRLLVVETSPWAEITLVLPDGRRLQVAADGSSPEAEAVWMVLRTPWEAAALEPAEQPASEGARIEVEGTGEEPLVLTLWPAEGVARIGSAAGVWRMSEAFWSGLAAAGALGG